MNEQQAIAELTVAELRRLIRETVQEAMAEILVELSVAAEHDAELTYQAEITDLLRASLQERLAGTASMELMPLVDD
jgi:histone H3/H4